MINSIETHLAERKMDCPKCRCVMNKVESSSFSVMKCSGCSGLWFRDGNHELAKEEKGAKKIDCDDTNAQSVYNEVRDINCPECKQRMIKMVDSAQLHIKFEACSPCRGVFFDAGEFKDYTEFTLVERVTQAVSILRSNLK